MELAGDQPRYISSPEQLEAGAFYCLPHEKRLLAAQLKDIEARRHGLAKDIAQAMEQSSETWHDNAPADVLFGDLKQIDKQEMKLLAASRELIMVSYPSEAVDFVTIGSRVLCDVQGDNFLLDVLGNIPVSSPEIEGIDQGTIAAPLPRSLLGKKEGEVAMAVINGRELAITVVAIDQTAQQADFAAPDTQP
jgi:transcription elongation GreA/GreB family factor